MAKNRLQPLNDLLVRGTRERKPGEAMVPARFARYEVIDLFRRFEVTGLADKGTLSNGIADVGWEVEAGWTGELDLAVFLPSGSIAGQLQPKLTVGGGQTASTMLVMQRLPAQVIFPLDQGGVNTVRWHTNRPISLLTLGALKGKKKTFFANFGIDFQLGKGLKDTVGPITPKPPEPQEDNRTPFTGDNTMYMGVAFGINGSVKVTWARLIEPFPGQYKQAMSDEIQDDFASIIGIRNKDGLKKDIYKWLRFVVLNKANLTQQNQDAVKKAVSDTVVSGKALIKATDGLKIILGAAVAEDNPVLGSLNAFKDWQVDPGTVKLIQNLQAFKQSLEDEPAPLRQEQQQQLAQVGWFIDQLYLQNPYKGSQAEVFYWIHRQALAATAADGATQAKVKKTYQPKQSIKKQATALQKVLAVFYGNDSSKPVLRSTEALMTWTNSPTSPSLAESLKLFAKQSNNPAVKGEATILAGKLEKIITDTKIARAKRNPMVVKQGSVEVPAYIGTEASKLTYYDLLSVDGEFGASTGPKLIVPLWAQVVVAGSVGATAGVEWRGRKSGYRLQTLCMSKKKRGDPMLITQDTRMTYSQAKVKGQMWADMVVFNAQPTLTPTSINQAYETARGIEQSGAAKLAEQGWSATKDLAKKGGDKVIPDGAKRLKDRVAGMLPVLNCFEYVSAVGYWRYPANRGDQKVIVGRGSGLSFGCSVLLKRLIKLAQYPNTTESRHLANGIMLYLGIDFYTLLSFLNSIPIDALARWDDLPESLIIESGFAFPDGFEIDLKDVDNKRLEPKNLLDSQPVEDMLKSIRKRDANAPQADVLRLRFRLADWLDASNVEFKLGLWGSVVPGIKLRPIYKAEQSGVIDLFTHHITHPQRNNPRPKEPKRNDPNYAALKALYDQAMAHWQADQELTVPPVAILHQ